ncbi:MAG: Crp/Fnr family transcriptional regulator [Bacteroidales bacterium]|nr:Crp/Fnr family transcriptional regulator [Bacteroidales bacterium]
MKRNNICESCNDCNSNSALFMVLNKEEADLLNIERYEVHFKAGENIVKQGTILTHLTNLVKGFAKVYIEGYGNKNLLLNLIGPNTLLGGQGLYSSGRNQYTITALEESIVCFVNTESFKSVLQSNSIFAERYISQLNNEAIYTYNKLLGLTQKQMHGRMADALIYMADKVYKNHDFELPIGRQDLADMTAMSKDSAIRILKELEKDGFAKFSGRRVLIKNMSGLINLSENG